MGMLMLKMSAYAQDLDSVVSLGKKAVAHWTFFSHDVVFLLNWTAVSHCLFVFYKLHKSGDI